MSGIQFVKVVVTVGVGHRGKQRSVNARVVRRSVQFHRHVGDAHVAGIVGAVVVVVHEHVVTYGYQFDIAAGIILQVCIAIVIKIDLGNVV